mgnify:CR=1 FL=1
MKNKFKHTLENISKELIIAAVITSSTIAFALQVTTNSRKYQEKYLIERISKIPEIPEVKMPFEIKKLDYQKREKLLADVFKKVKLPSYIDKDYIRKKIAVESEWNPNAVSKAGARGLMQIMPGTWSDYDSTNYDKNVFNPEKNIEVGLKHLVWQDEFCRRYYPGWENLSSEKKRDIMSAGYNIGMGKLKRENWNIKKTYSETQKHVEKMRKK